MDTNEIDQSAKDIHRTSRVRGMLMLTCSAAFVTFYLLVLYSILYAINK